MLAGEKNAIHQSFNYYANNQACESSCEEILINFQKNYFSFMLTMTI